MYDQYAEIIAEDDRTITFQYTYPEGTHLFIPNLTTTMTIIKDEEENIRNMTEIANSITPVAYYNPKAKELLEVKTREMVSAYYRRIRSMKKRKY